MKFGRDWWQTGDDDRSGRFDEIENSEISDFFRVNGDDDEIYEFSTVNGVVIIQENRKFADFLTPEGKN